MDVRNLFNVQERTVDEVFENLVRSPHFRLERIVSTGQATPAGQWISQRQPEWVVLLSGAAGLRFEGQDSPIELRPGDHLLIPGDERHRVEWTQVDSPTVWLALHWSEDGSEPLR